MKPLKITEDLKEILIRTFETNISTSFLKGSIYTCPIDIAPVLPEVIKPTIVFTAEAYNKMTTLVAKETGEIGWHGIVEKGENNTYTITDILVYPQIVTAATVNTDDEEYINWTLTLPLDDFNKMRFQGHSHVNMGVSPSAVDEKLYEDILEHIPDNQYYIFMIINKRQEFMVRVYDMEAGMLFEKEDITVVTPSSVYDTWYSSVKTVIQPPKVINYTPAPKAPVMQNSLYTEMLKEKHQKTKWDKEMEDLYEWSNTYDPYPNRPESFRKKKRR